MVSSCFRSRGRMLYQRRHRLSSGAFVANCCLAMGAISAQMIRNLSFVILNAAVPCRSVCEDMRHPLELSLKYKVEDLFKYRNYMLGKK